MTPQPNIPTPRTDFEANALKEAIKNGVSFGDNVRVNFARQLERELTQWKEDAERLAANAHHFASGVEFVNLGKIKAYLPTELAKQITHLNYLADSALAAHNQLVKQEKGRV